VDCTRCGNAIAASSSFCARCGEPVRTLSGTGTDPGGGAPSPFSREAVSGPPRAPSSTAYAGSDPAALTGPPALPDGAALPEPVGPAGPTADEEGYGTPRTVAELLAGLGNGVLGLLAIGVYGALQVLWALVIALNDDRPSKAGFVVLALLLVAVATGATGVLLQRAKAVRDRGGSLDVVHALSVGAGVLVSVYGVLVLLTALVSDEAQALNGVF
jgi:hypothetical protein